MPNQTTVDPHYLVYLRLQAVHLDSQISALLGQHHITPSATVPTRYSRHTSPVSYKETSASRPYTKRNPARECSKWRYYAVKNSLEVNDVYSSWHQACPYCWDPATQYFIPGSICKGFDEYEDTWDFLLGVEESHITSSNIEETVSNEAPEVCVPTETADLLALPPVPPHHVPQESTIPSYVSTDNNNDRDSLNICDYNNLVKPQYCSKILTKAGLMIKLRIIQHPLNRLMQHRFYRPLQTRRPQNTPQNLVMTSTNSSTIITGVSKSSIY